MSSSSSSSSSASFASAPSVRLQRLCPPRTEDGVRRLSLMGREKEAWRVGKVPGAVCSAVRSECCAFWDVDDLTLIVREWGGRLEVACEVGSELLRAAATAPPAGGAVGGVEKPTLGRGTRRCRSETRWGRGRGRGGVRRSTGASGTEGARGGEGVGGDVAVHARAGGGAGEGDSREGGVFAGRIAWTIRPTAEPRRDWQQLGAEGMRHLGGVLASRGGVLANLHVLVLSYNEVRAGRRVMACWRTCRCSTSAATTWMPTPHGT
jgi:hypothetical protein